MTRSTLIAVAVLLATRSVSGDLIAYDAPRSATHDHVGAASPVLHMEHAGAVTIDDTTFIASNLLAVSHRQLSGFAPLSESRHADVIQLRDEQSTAALFISALVTVGAWHLVRSAKHLSLGHLPEWYHSGGPAQIGHITPFSLDFAGVTLAVFDVPSTHPVLCLDARRARSTRVVFQRHLIPADPRGPPIQ